MSSPSCQQRKTGAPSRSDRKVDEPRVEIFHDDAELVELGDGVRESRSRLSAAARVSVGRLLGSRCRRRFRRHPRRARQAVPVRRGGRRGARRAARRAGGPERALRSPRSGVKRRCRHRAMIPASWRAVNEPRSASSSGAVSPSGRSPPARCCCSSRRSTPTAFAGTPSGCTSSAGSSTSGRAGTATGTCGSPRTATRGRRSTPAFFPLYPLLVGGTRPRARRALPARRRARLARGGRRSVRAALPPRAAALGAAGARRTLLYVALFPTALFLGAVYGESLFLLLAVATFLLAEREPLRWAGGAAGLAFLTRPTGLVLVAALALLAWRSR